MVPPRAVAPLQPGNVQEMRIASTVGHPHAETRWKIVPRKATEQLGPPILLAVDQLFQQLEMVILCHPDLCERQEKWISHHSRIGFKQDLQKSGENPEVVLSHAPRRFLSGASPFPFFPFFPFCPV